VQGIYSHIFYPSTLNELLNLKNKNPDAVVWSGGTGLMGKQKRKIPVIPDNIIQISKISELKKIRRTERYLEIGAGASINKILNVGQHVLPNALAQAMKLIKPSTIRNMATLGGHLCMPDKRLNLFSVMILMDVSLELKRAGGARWIQLTRFFNKNGKIQLKNNEILTRIRIPFGNWTWQLFKSDGNPFFDTGQAISFCILAEIQKGIINDYRMVIGNSGKHTVRNIEMESLLIGKKLPLSLKESSFIVEKYKEWIKSQTMELTPFQRDRTIRFIYWILKELLP
jgi:CO/xanthine dehydrogenase FAD-binding subunit